MTKYQMMFLLAWSMVVDKMYRISLYLSSIDLIKDLASFEAAGIEIVPILSPREYSRQGNSSIKDVGQYLNFKGKKVIELDGLYTEDELHEICHWVKMVSHQDRIHFRVKDLGLLYFILKETNAYAEFLGETYNNSFAISTIAKFGERRITLIGLSNEYSYEMIEKVTSRVDKDIEYMGFGPNLIFYSPRKLLSPLGKVDNFSDDSTKTIDKGINLMGKSEESPHKGFMLHEGSLGTLMYHPKYLNNLNEIFQLIKFGIHSFKVDLRMIRAIDTLPLLENILKFFKKNQNETLENYPHFNGYLRKNKSNKIFHKLKNRVFEDFDLAGNKFIGKCIDVHNQKYILIESFNKDPICSLDIAQFLNPNGKVIKASLEVQECIHQSFDKDIYRIRFIKGVTPMSRVYFENLG
ncbi:U32 family peptidase [Bacteriovoracaceae bacterium]|nr:U32 family peptidase [Bacteriovoracaceae bacterium]